MTSKDSSYYRIRAIVNNAGNTELQPADEAVLRSILRDVTETEACAVLEDFFDVEPITLAIYEEFLTRGSDWERFSRERLAKSLVFCGFDEEAQAVLGTLQ